MDFRMTKTVTAFLEADNEVSVDVGLLTLNLGSSPDGLTIFLGYGEGKAELAAANADRLIEQLMKLREAALRQAVREGDQADAEDVDEYVRSLGRPPLRAVDKVLDEATAADPELMRDEFHGRGLDGSL